MPKIWSPVILAQLNSLRTLAVRRVYTLKQNYRAIEDLRVKINSCEAHSHGKYVEGLIHLDILALLQNSNNDTELVHIGDTIRECLAADYFNPSQQLTAEASMIVDVAQVSCEGELEGQLIRVQIHIDYNILALQHEAIELNESPQADISSVPWEFSPGQAILDTIHNLEYEVHRLSQDNAALNRRIMLNEKNLDSLKNSLRRAESRNQALCIELTQSKQIMQTLKERLEQNKTLANRGIRPITYPHSGIQTSNPVNWGDKIKQLFAIG